MAHLVPPGTAGSLHWLPADVLEAQRWGAGDGMVGSLAAGTYAPLVLGGVGGAVSMTAMRMGQQPGYLSLSSPIAVLITSSGPDTVRVKKTFSCGG